jgi:hypothetical protein
MSLHPDLIELLMAFEKSELKLIVASFQFTAIYVQC